MMIFSWLRPRRRQGYAGHGWVPRRLLRLASAVRRRTMCYGAIFDTAATAVRWE